MTSFLCWDAECGDAKNGVLVDASDAEMAACMAGLHALKMDADHRSDEIGELEEAIAKALGGTA